MALVDGTHIKFHPPREINSGYINRHHWKSYNIAIATGADYTIYFVNVNHAGSWHDSRIIQDSELWTSFETEGRRSIPSAVILVDSAYMDLTSWLIPPYQGDHAPDSPKDV